MGRVPRRSATRSRHFDGNANFDEIIFPTKGFSGLTLRLYNPDTGQWSLYWASKRTGTLFPPVTGAFKDGVGEFLGEDTHNDVPDTRPVPVDGHHSRLGPLGAGLLHRRRRDLARQLVHGRDQATLNRAGSGYPRRRPPRKLRRNFGGRIPR